MNSKKSGYVYVIDYGDGKTFKIGMTRTGPQNRMAQINKAAILMPKQYGMKMVMSGEFANCYYLEQLLHDRFESLRDNGEWFKLDFPDLVETYQVFTILGDSTLYDRWYELVPYDHEGYISHGVINPYFPSFKQPA